WRDELIAAADHSNDSGLRKTKIHNLFPHREPIFGNFYLLHHSLGEFSGQRAFPFHGLDTFRQGDMQPPGYSRQRSTLNQDGSYGNKEDRKSTRLNSSHVKISYAVFCLKKKK